MSATVDVPRRPLLGGSGSPGVLPQDAAVPGRGGKALTTRYLDFWLLGGASIAVWAVMFVASGFRTSWAVDQHFSNLTLTTASLSLLINYPHFLVSYKLAYGRGRQFIGTNWFQLLLVPVLLIGLFACAFAFYDVPAANLPLVPTLAGLLADWGNNARVLSAPRLGDLLFTAAFHLMLLTVGWHYTKQVFGCMMVYAHFDGYALSPSQRTLLRWSTLSVWWPTFAYGNIGATPINFSQFTYYALDLPDVAVPLLEGAVAIGFVWVVYAVFYRNYHDRGQLPSATFVVPLLAIYLWWLPVTRQPEFYLLLTPLFHSLQYLAFVYKMERSRLSTLRHVEVRATAVIAGLILAGWLAFEFVPNTLDVQLATFNSWKMFFFFTAATLFINVHHYFIDNVLWRFRDPNVQKYLLT